MGFLDKFVPCLIFEIECVSKDLRITSCLYKMTPPLSPRELKCPVPSHETQTKVWSRFVFFFKVQHEGNNITEKIERNSEPQERDS